MKSPVVPAALLSTALVVSGCRNQPPVVPAPIGPAQGRDGIAYTFSASATDPDGDSVAIRFNWSDNANSEWSPWLLAGDTARMAHAWPGTGVYPVRAQARDARGARSAWSPAAMIGISDTFNQPPVISSLTGPDSGFIGIAYTFRATATDPEGDDVWLRFACDHGETTFWRHYLPGDTPVAFIDSWNTGGPHYVTVQAADEAKAESDWSAPLCLNVSREGTVRWHREAWLTDYACPAVGPDGTIYLGGRHEGFEALNPDGTTLWHVDVSATSSPAFGADRTIYVGMKDSSGSALLALRTDGTEIWRFPLEADVEGPPAIGVDGTLYFGSGDGRLCALSPDCTLRWSHRFARGIDEPCAIGPDGTVYCENGLDSLYAFEPDGTVKWAAAGGAWFPGLAIGADGAIYCGSRDGSNYFLCALGPDGSVRWRYQTPGVFWTAPVVGPDGSVYLGTVAGVVSVSHAGSLNWVVPVSARSNPVVRADGVICFGTTPDEGSFLALHPDGSVRWRLSSPDYSPYETAPAIAADGTILVYDGHDILYALHGTSPLADSPWPKFQRDLANSGRAGGR